MKNIFRIILLSISLSYILNKSKNEEYISSNLNFPINNIMDNQFEDKNKYKLDENENCEKMVVGNNKLEIKNNVESCLNCTDLCLKDNDYLIFTDLYDVQNIITQVDVWNESLCGDKLGDKLVRFNGTGDKNGFINIKAILKDEFEINKDITREYFYNTSITMLKGISKQKFFINIIPTDNNSDLYFFQTNRSSIRGENKDRINFIYVNNFSTFGDNIEALYKNITTNFMKRERYINGKIEIFGYLYSGLNQDYDVTISYKQIKGTGIVGPAVSLSVLFAALVVVVAFFIKNTYCDTVYKKRLTMIKEED